MTSVAASISKSAASPRVAPLHRTSSGAARLRAKATSAGVGAAMCAERSSTRHGASVGRPATRRVASSALSTPNSRADGSANGAACVIGGGVRRAQRTRTTTLPTFSPACSSRNAARSSPSQKEKVACGGGRTAPASTCRANRPSCACIHSGSPFQPGQLRQPSSTATATKSTAAAAAAARAALQTPCLPMSRKAPASPSSPSEAGVKSRESALSTTFTRPPRSCAPTPAAKLSARRELESAATPSRRSVACLATLPAVACTRAPHRRSCSSATSPTPPVAECTSTHWPARTRASRSAYATVTHSTGSVTASSKLSLRGMRPSQRVSVCSTERSEPGASPKTRSPAAACATSAPHASSRPDTSPPSGRTSPVGSRPSTLSTSRKLSPAAATATTPPCASRVHGVTACARVWRWRRLPGRSRCASTSAGSSAAAPHLNARRRDTKRGGSGGGGGSHAWEGVDRRRAWTIVPLYPNDETPPTSPLSAPEAEARPRPITGSASAAASPGSAARTCALSTRSCAFGASARRASPAASSSRPLMPAAGSACPALALTLPTAIGGAGAVPVREGRKAPTALPISIGSPSAVPVPWASRRVTMSASTPASASAARSSACCACPLGAVRLALRPSHRTALPSSSTDAVGTSSTRCSTATPHASARAYPSARASKVWQRPRGEVMPATAKLTPTPGSSIRFTPATTAASHSRNCSARRPPCAATSAAEHAVSKPTQAPCSPSTYERRPEATECAAPVAAYTLCPSGDALSTSAKSLDAMPTKTPTLLPSSDARSCPAAWSAS
eukprot:scaffold80720_cov71-Phaeocystis_antarctica.AAC.6